MERGELETLDRGTCLDLLATVAVGRLAWAGADARVQVRPVNFVVDGSDVLVRCQDGAMLDAARAGRPFSFEADQVEPALRGGWSVLVVCAGAQVTDGSGAPLPEPWAAGERPHVLRLVPEAVTGRRLQLAGGEISVVRLDPDPS